MFNNNSFVISSAAFYIIKTTGAIWMLHELDRETLPVYVLNVSVQLDPAAHSSHRRQKRAVDTSIGTVTLISSFIFMISLNSMLYLWIFSLLYRI